MKFLILFIVTFLWAEDIGCEKLKNEINKNIIINLTPYHDFSNYEKKYKLRFVKQVTKNIYVYEAQSVDKVCSIINELKNLEIVKSIHPDTVKRNYLR